MDEMGMGGPSNVAHPAASPRDSDPSEPHQQADESGALLASLQDQLSEATACTRRLEQELAAFRARRSVRAVVTLADAAYAAGQLWQKYQRERGGVLAGDSESPLDVHAAGSAARGATVALFPPTRQLLKEEPPSLAGARLRISAVIPCFNGSTFLEEALQSIQSQTRAVEEIIVVDDGSTDGSAELAERWGATVIRHGVNRGEAAARNTGWRAATGDAIAWLDSDDSWRPNHVEVVGALLERHPEVAAAFGASQRFGLDDQVVAGLVPEGGPHELLHEAFQSWLHTHNSCLIRRTALEEISGYDERGGNSIDYDMWLRLARHNRFVSTHEVTANWRWHSTQLSSAPVAQIVAVQRFRRRFLRALRANGEFVLADELEQLVGPAWTAHLQGVQGMAELRKRRTLEELGEAYRGPSRTDRVRWAVLRWLPPSVIGLIWPLAGRVLEP
jgi:Glycosyl transferase family 2